MKRPSLIILLSMATFFVQSCIGTDVVDAELVEPQLKINSPITELAVGESYQFMVDYFNQIGVREMAPVVWSSSNPEIISIDDNGLAMARMMGRVTISAMHMGVEDSFELMAGNETTVINAARMGSFTGANNYSVEGDFTVEEVDGKLRVTFKSNFQSSTGPGLFIYLSNSASSIAGGLELGGIKASRGSQFYETNLQNARLQTYDYVLVWCKPFGVLFGVGEIIN